MRIAFTLNGAAVAFEADPYERASQVLGARFGLESVKLSCGVGRCGACGVLVDGEPVNACLLLAAKLEGRELVTAEGLGARADAAIAALERHGAVQCGYCAPGLLVSLVAAIERRAPLSDEEIEAWFAGHLCRCSGYVGLKRAARELLGADISG